MPISSKLLNKGTALACYVHGQAEMGVGMNIRFNPFCLIQPLGKIIGIPLLFLLASCGGGGGGGGTTGTDSAGSSQGNSNTSSTPINPVSITYSNYLNPISLITMKYPQTWSRHFDSSQPELVIELRSPPSETQSSYLDVVVLYKQSLTNLSAGGEDDGSSLTMVSERTLNVAGVPAFEFIADTVDGDQSIRLVFFDFVINDDLYTLAYANTRSEFARKIDIIRYMASTISVGQNIISGTSTFTDWESPGKPAIASDGQNFLVVSCRRMNRTSNPTTPESLMGRLVRADRSMGPEFVIDSVNFNCVNRHEVVFDGINYLVIYKGVVLSTSASPILARRISRSGVFVDSEPIRVSPPSSTVYEPAAVFDGTRTLVVWHRYGNINNAVAGAFINTNGTITSDFTIADNLEAIYPDPNGVSISPHVAYSNNQFMVIWSRYFGFNPHFPRNYPIYGQLIDLAGNRLLPQPLEIRSDPGTMPRYTQITSDGTDYLVTWIEGVLSNSFNGGGNHTVYARKISQSGNLLNGAASQTGVMIAPPIRVTGTGLGSTIEEAVKNYLDVSFSDGNYLFLWQSPLHDQAGMHSVKASKDLSIITAPSPVVGIYKDVSRIGNIPSFTYTQPNIAYSNNQSLVVWPSRTGFVEGWFNMKFTQ